MRHWQMWVAAAIAGTMGLGATVWAKDSPTLLFVLDASLSMRDSLEGRSKLATAKQVLTELLRELPAQTQVGLEVYGHRRPHDCKDIELASPIAAFNAQALSAQVAAIRAEGSTPIAASLKKAAEALSGISGTRTIVLVSDGVETCGGDPVREANRIREEYGVDVVIQVVGFAVDEPVRKQLAQIAQAGGGAYYSADSAKQLKDSLTSIKEEVVEAPPAPSKKELWSWTDEFKDDYLADEWEILSSDPDNRMLDNGTLVILTQPGSIQQETLHNILLYQGEIPVENYAVETKFSGTISVTNNWYTQEVGLILYDDPENYVLLSVSGKIETYGYLRYVKHVALAKYQKGEKVSSVELDGMDEAVLGKDDIYFLKVEKRKFKYEAFYSEDGVDWRRVGELAVLGKKLAPGFFVWRDVKAAETFIAFDRFSIKELE